MGKENSDLPHEVDPRGQIIVARVTAALEETGLIHHPLIEDSGDVKYFFENIPEYFRNLKSRLLTAIILPPTFPDSATFVCDRLTTDECAAIISNRQRHNWYIALVATAFDILRPGQTWAEFISEKQPRCIEEPFADAVTIARDLKGWWKMITRIRTENPKSILAKGNGEEFCSFKYLPTNLEGVLADIWFQSDVCGPYCNVDELLSKKMEVGGSVVRMRLIIERLESSS